MTQSSMPIQPEAVGRTTQVIVGALMAGLLTFAGVALLIGQQPQPPAAQAPILPYLGIGGAALLVAVRFVLTDVISQKAARATAGQAIEVQRQSLAAIYSTKTIIGAALLEGAGFFNLVAYLVERSPMNIAVVAVLLTILAVTFPSQTKFENWADHVRRDLSV